MACTHYNMSQGWVDFINVCDNSFIVIFTLEAFLRIMAVTFKSYWAEGWNKFDFFIVVVSIIGKIGTNIPGILWEDNFFFLLYIFFYRFQIWKFLKYTYHGKATMENIFVIFSAKLCLIINNIHGCQLPTN